MCTLIYVPWVSSPFGAAIGLNRDEIYGRPSGPPRWWAAEGDEVGFVAPVDELAGGTWFGVNGDGLFVALTNGLQEGAFRHERSRGELVAAALKRGSLRGAIEALTVRDVLAYAPCHLLLVQRGRLAYVAPDEHGRFAATSLEDEPHTLTNAGLDLGDTPPIPQMPDLVGPPSGAELEEPIARTRGVLTTHDGPHPRCRHAEDRGTVSSAVLLLGSDLAGSRLFFADGPPCVTEYREVVGDRHGLV